MTVSRPMKRLLFWTPRILRRLNAVLVSLSVLEVYKEGYDVWETDVALFMHMVPTVVVLLALGVGRGAAPVSVPPATRWVPQARCTRTRSW